MPKERVVEVADLSEAIAANIKAEPDPDWNLDGLLGVGLRRQPIETRRFVTAAIALDAARELAIVPRLVGGVAVPISRLP